MAVLDDDLNESDINAEHDEENNYKHANEYADEDMEVDRAHHENADEDIDEIPGEDLPPILRLPAELRIQIFEYAVFSSDENLKSLNWDQKCNNGQRSYKCNILPDLRILLNVCRQFKQDVALVDVPLTALLQDVNTRQWREIKATSLGWVYIRARTSSTVDEAKQRAEDQVEGLSRCVVSRGQEHHFGIMYLNKKPEFGVKVFRKVARIGSSKSVLRGMGDLKDRPSEGVAKGIPVGMLAGVQVKRLWAVTRD